MRRAIIDNPPPTDAISIWRERRKFGTDSPHEPTDEFVVQAFAEGARSLWPDSRDPGWHVTFQHWLDAHRAAAWQRGFDSDYEGDGWPPNPYEGR